MALARSETADQVVARLRALDVCAVSDALDRLGLGTVVTGVPQASGGSRVAGRAVTMRLGTGAPPPGPPRHLGTTAIEAGDADSVIVVEQRTGIDAGSWGGLLTLGAMTRGIAGVLADGPVRDLDEAIGYGFPIWTRSTTARTARGRVVENGTNVPIVFEGVAVDPGDYVVADRSGIAFITPGNIAAVLETAEAIVAREAAMAAAIRAGTPMSAVMGGNYEHMLKADG
jgi:regulator of RNase E activity RraA